MEYLVLKDKSGKIHFMNLAQMEEIGLGSSNKEAVYFVFPSAESGRMPTMFEVENIESITTNVRPLAEFLSELHDDLEVCFNAR